MFEIEATDRFERWLGALRDKSGQAIILRRIDRVRLGNFDNTRPVGEGINELKIDFGPGYRIYYKQTGNAVLLLLCGGDKSSQDKDIAKAKELADGL